MATRPLQTITLKNEDGDDITYTLSGEYPDLIAGSAEQIITNIHESDSVPYVFRPTPYNSTRESGDIVGASVAWNQIITTQNFTSTTTDTRANLQVMGKTVVGNTTWLGSTNITETGIWTKVFKNVLTTSGGVKIIHNGSSNNITIGYADDIINTHVYLISIDFTGVDVSTVGGLVAKNMMMFDLTLALGSTIADYIYTLESGTAGAGVAKLREWGFFTKPYYAYNAGGIESVNVSKHRMVGLNQWDEVLEVGGIDDTTGQDAISPTQTRSKNYIPVTPATNYFAHIPYAGSGGIYVYYYDGNKNFISRAYVNASYNVKEKIFQTPANCTYIRFKAQSNTNDYRDICINISDPAINGTYEPYTVNEYPLDYSLTLRGILKLDGSNNLYADGDVYEADGTVTRKYGIVDLGTIDWTYRGPSNANTFSADSITNYKHTTGVIGIISKYTAINNVGTISGVSQYSADKIWAFYYSSSNPTSSALYIKDTAYTDAATFKTAMSGIYLVYELATPTTETADPYNEVQVCSPFGTEQFVDYAYSQGTRDVEIPVGHNTNYYANLAGALERIMVQVPAAPSSNGTYKLTCVVSGGVAIYSWVSN